MPACVLCVAADCGACRTQAAVARIGAVPARHHRAHAGVQRHHSCNVQEVCFGQPHPPRCVHVCVCAVLRCSLCVCHSKSSIMQMNAHGQCKVLCPGGVGVSVCVWSPKATMCALSDMAAV